MGSYERLLSLITEAKEKARTSGAVLSPNYSEDEYIAFFLYENSIVIPPVSVGETVWCCTTQGVVEGIVSCVDIRQTGKHFIVINDGTDKYPPFKLIYNFEAYEKNVFKSQNEAEEYMKSVT